MINFWVFNIGTTKNSAKYSHSFIKRSRKQKNSKKKIKILCKTWTSSKKEQEKK